MKKLIFILAGLMLMSVIHAQSLEEIVKRYTNANKLDKVSSLKTIKITGNMSMMGMEMPMTIWMKNPNKIKTVTSINGQEMIQVYDGEKGYMINPATGSTEPMEMTNNQANQILRNSIFQNNLVNFLQKGQLVLVGEELVSSKYSSNMETESSVKIDSGAVLEIINGKIVLPGEETEVEKPAYKLKASLKGGDNIYIYVDKASFLIVKTSATFSEGGVSVRIDSFPSGYKEMNGFLLPMKNTTSVQGMELVMNFTKVEVDTPMLDSIFKIN